MSMNGPSLRGAVDLSSLANRRQASAAPLAAGPSEPILIATDSNFASVMELSRQVPVVVDLWASWCQPCTQLTPILENIVREYAGRVVLAKVDVDANPGLAQAFQAQSIPTIAAVLGGQLVPMFTGALPEAQVREVFEQLLQVAASNGITGQVPVGDAPGGAGESVAEKPVSVPLPPHHQAAYEAIEAGEYDRAAAEYGKALAENPRDAEATAGLAQVRLLGRLQGKTPDAIRSAAAAEPDRLAAQLDVADLDLSGGHISDAFDRLLNLFASASADDKTVIRERLLELFEVVGVTDERVHAARARLSQLLY